MTLKEMKKKVLGLIEELNKGNPVLTDDPDIETKINSVINQVQNELSRMKKIPSYTKIEVEAGQLLEFEDIEKASGYVVYQLDRVRGIKHELLAQGTIIECLESGTAMIEFFRYPEEITDKTKDSYEFELSTDVLEIMPYGVASDLLKSDVSANYGAEYTQRYETMLNRLDHRYSIPKITIEGGISI